jgi:KDO2-lipid IV(A) lauroyltransferase
MLKNLRRFATFLLIKALVILAEILPRRLGHRVFGGLGGLAYRMLRGPRRVALANLRLVYGGQLSDSDLRDTARKCFTNLGRFAYDAARIGKYTTDNLKDLVEVVGQHHLDDALARGEGLVAISGHIGNWEFLGAYLAKMGYPTSALATRVRNQRLDDLLAGLRRRSGLRLLERSRSLLGAFRCLKEGGILGVLMDQDTSVESVTVDFLGHPARTPVGPAKLASSTGACVLPMAMLMTSDGRYRLEIGEPISINGDGGSLVDDVARCSRALEEFIRLEPAQWVWMHKRWKSVCAEMYA